MIRNEAQLKQESVKTGIVGCLVAALVSIVLKRIDIVLGYGLGFVVSLIIYEMDCLKADSILKFQQIKPYSNYVLFCFIKYILYALGMLLAIKKPLLLNLFAVAVGYLVVKITIFRLALFRR